MAENVELRRTGGNSYDEKLNVKTSWDIIENKPTNFTPDVHSHDIEEVNTLEDELDNRYTKTETDTKISEEIGKIDIPTHLSELSQNASYRTVTDDEKATWDAKETTTGSQAKADNALADAKAYTETQTSNALTSAKGYTDTEVGAVQNDLNAFKSQKGVSGGLATLDNEGYVPSAQLPSYVDDVLIYDNYAELPQPGETGKIYVTRNDNLTYRWGGTDYVEISKSLALGETSSTAYAGSKGKANRNDINNIINTYATQSWVTGRNYVNTTLMNSTLLNYAKTSDIPSLAGYATESWVENKNYAKVTDIPTVPTDLSAFNNDMQFLTFQDVQGNYVPISRKINGKSLSSDMTLTASDVGAANTYVTFGNYSEIPPGKRWVSSQEVSNPDYSVGTTASEPSSSALPAASGLTAGTTGHVYTQSLPMLEAYYIVQEVGAGEGLITLRRNDNGQVSFTIPKPGDGGSSENNYLENVTGSGNGIVRFYISGQESFTHDFGHSHQVSQVTGLENRLDGKVDKVTGKGLSTNDFTAALKSKLDGVESGANKYTHPSYTARSAGFYKVRVNNTGHVDYVTSVFASDIPNLPASKITSGTFDIDRIPTGTTSSTVALGNHNHSDDYLPLTGTALLSVDSQQWGGYKLRVGSGVSPSSDHITFSW